MVSHWFLFDKYWHNLIPTYTINKPIVESNRKLIMYLKTREIVRINFVKFSLFVFLYHVHGSPWNRGAKYTFVMCITRAPIPCFDVSYHHVSQGRRTYGGSQKRLPGINKVIKEKSRLKLFKSKKLLFLHDNLG